MTHFATLIATRTVRDGKLSEFHEWHARHNEIIARFPGYASSDLIPPLQSPVGEWTFIVNFHTLEELRAWRESPERADLFRDLQPLVRGAATEKLVEPGAHEEDVQTEVTQIIISKVKPGMESRHREWAGRIQQAQAMYPGYRGTYLQQPASPDGHWTTLLRFDTPEHFDAWRRSPERKALLEEAREFIENEEVAQLASSFPGWVPLDAKTGKPPPNWKAALLVLLGLYPIVVLQLHLMSPLLQGILPPVATFIGNIISVSATSFVTMPVFVRLFSRWLFAETAKENLTGVLILVGLFAAEILVLTLIFH